MADVPLYVVIVTAGASVISASVPIVIGWARDSRREKHAEAKDLARERAELAVDNRELCVKLLSLSRHFRELVENAYDSPAPVLDADVKQVRRSVAEVRRSVADVASQADKVEFNVPKAGTAAVSLTEAAKRLASTAEKKRREHGSALDPSDFKEFDDCLEEFKDSARSALDEL